MVNQSTSSFQTAVKALANYCFTKLVLVIIIILLRKGFEELMSSIINYEAIISLISFWSQLIIKNEVIISPSSIMWLMNKRWWITWLPSPGWSQDKCGYYCIIKDSLYYPRQTFPTKMICYLFEWLNNCCLMPTQQFFSYIMAGTSYFSMKWWWGLLCTIPTCWVGFL
jgi:hypothetical protein